LYGNHLSQEVIDSIIAPKDDSKELVMQWLNHEGLGEYASISPRADSVIVQASISQIEKLLKAKYSAFGEKLPSVASNSSLKLSPL
jgi:tripeptidyl-peptidase-1